MRSQAGGISIPTGLRDGAHAPLLRMCAAMNGTGGVAGGGFSWVYSLPNLVRHSVVMIAPWIKRGLCTLPRVGTCVGR